jgi:hypothetical protein
MGNLEASFLGYAGYNITCHDYWINNIDIRPFKMFESMLASMISKTRVIWDSAACNRFQE